MLIFRSEKIGKNHTFIITQKVHIWQVSFNKLLSFWKMLKLHFTLTRRPISNFAYYTHFSFFFFFERDLCYFLIYRESDCEKSRLHQSSYDLCHVWILPSRDNFAINRWISPSTYRRHSHKDCADPSSASSSHSNKWRPLIARHSVNWCGYIARSNTKFRLVCAID